MGLVRDNIPAVCNRTYGEMKARRTYQAHSHIRENARRIFSRSGVSCCQACGYSRHVEVCHVKAIHLHNDLQTIGEINDPANLVGLCPNCHWEYDHGILKLPPRVLTSRLRLRKKTTPDAALNGAIKKREEPKSDSSVKNHTIC